MINQLKKINFILEKRQKLSLILLFILVFMGLVLEIISLASIAPLIDIVLRQKGEELNNLSLIKWFYSFFENNINFSKFFILLVLLIFSIKTLYFFILTYRQNIFLANLNSNVGNKLFLKYLSNNYSFFVSSNNSYLVKNLQVEVSYFNAYCQNILTLFVESFLVLSILATLLYIEPLYTIGLSILLSFIIFSIVFITKKRVAYFGLQRESIDSKLAKTSTDAFGAIKTIILSNKINFFGKTYFDLNIQRSKYVSMQTTLSQLPRYIIEFIIILGLLSFLFVNGDYNENNLNVITTLGLFITALFRLMPSLNKILASYQSLKFYDASIDTIYKEINRVGESNTLNTQETQLSNESIIVNNLSFSHKGKLIFKNLYLDIKINDTIGIIGPSGSGKSTFIDIFMGLLIPTKGNIFYKNKSIHSNLSAWHSLIGYVPQHTYLIDDSVKNNIAFGIPDVEINLKRLNQVILDSGLEEFINNLKDGIDQIVGQRGSFLSGGEIQRIGLARALYNNPKILILDEPTSALDNKMSNKIMKTISNLSGKLTIILITHDLDLLSQFNKVYQLESNMFKILKGK
jgi:ATP-binding cassette, subfamily B, bacterial PglK